MSWASPGWRLALLASWVPMASERPGAVLKSGDREIVITHSFAAPRRDVFDALTQPLQVLRWMKPTRFSLLACEIELRAGGSLRYVFQRPSGKKIEVRGVYDEVHPPERFAYLETYDFSPLRVRVRTNLVERDGRTLLTQTLSYESRRERDQDFDGVATSSREAFDSLERSLGGR
jgi:uncharacterized protein YndB with AHSA1/START domain